MSAFEIRCSKCGGEVDTVRAPDVEVREVGAVAAWNWVCRDCGKIVGTSIDYGRIDLGLVTDAQLNSGNDW